MTYALRFLPQVEADVWNGRTWYEDTAPGLEDRQQGAGLAAETCFGPRRVSSISLTRVRGWTRT